MDYKQITDKIIEYNSVIYDINNSNDWENLKIPNQLIEKCSKIEYQIYYYIIEYCIRNNRVQKPINLIIESIHKNFFTNTKQLINISEFKLSLSYLII